MEREPQNSFVNVFQEPAGVQAASVFRWSFGQADLNEAADQLFRRVDALMQATDSDRHVFLHTIEADVEAGRFPDIVAGYFDDIEWSYASRFHIAQMHKPDPEESYLVGRLTFEAAAGQTRRILGQNGGIRWAANLRVGGVQVSKHEVARGLELNPFDSQQARYLEKISRVAWAASHNLNAIAVWYRDVQLASVIRSVAP